jgi:hypothetical protein
MASFTLDRVGLIFFSLSLPLLLWAVLDTERFLRLLSFNRKTTFTPLELMAIKAPGTICMLGVVS